MHSTIYRELYIFAVCAVPGAVFGILGDLFGIWKKLINSRCFGIAADILLWTVFFCGTWIWLLHTTDGMLRFYGFTASAASFALYKLTLGRPVYRFLEFSTKKFVKFIHFVLKILLTPAQFLYKIYICIIKRKREKREVRIEHKIKARKRFRNEGACRKGKGFCKKK